MSKYVDLLYKLSLCLKVYPPQINSFFLIYYLNFLLLYSQVFNLNDLLIITI